MASFDEISQKVKGFAEVAWDKAKDVGNFAADKAKDVADTAKINLDISSERRDLDRNYRSIGQWYVSELQGEAPDAIRDVLVAIEKNKEKLAELERQKAAISADKKEETVDVEFFETDREEQQE